MDTTTSDGGASTAQPTETSEAVTTGHNADQVITTDSNGTPSLEPVTSQAQSASEEAVSEKTTSAPAVEETTETQAPADDIQSWAEKKGLPLDDPVKLAKMYRDAETKMHEATQKAREFETAALETSTVEYTGDPAFDSYAEVVNKMVIKDTVRDFFASTPEAREYESKMAEIVIQRPHLKGDLDALYALARNDPSREAELRSEGGRKALENLAQKQSQVPPASGATNSGVYQSQTITPNNVYDLVDSNDQAWFEKNHAAISKAMSGK